jgi:hypothetical protein
MTGSGVFEVTHAVEHSTVHRGSGRVKVRISAMQGVSTYMVVSPAVTRGGDERAYNIYDLHNPGSTNVGKYS